MSMHLVRLGMVVLAALLSSTQSMGASLGIAPVGLDLPATQKAATISLSNYASSPLNVQVRLFKWRQVDGKDELLPTQDVVASPPATSIPAGQTYMLRVARLTSAPVSVEESYRLVIDEIAPVADERAVGEGVSMVLRTSLPVFFSPKDAIPALQWRLYKEGDKLFVEVANTGRRHVKLIDLAAQLGSTTVSFGSGLAGYVLPGSVTRFSAALPASIQTEFAQGGSITLTGRTGATELREQVTLGGHR
jgi:fimbrial chaperone protein